jgi:VWFA-related protein
MSRRSLPALALALQLSISAVGQTPSPQTQPSSSSPAPTSSQQPQTDEDVVKISTRLVQVDAVVSDKSGQPVTDLKPDEVQIFEDGRPQKITHFSYVVADSSSPATRIRTTSPVDKTAIPTPAGRVSLRPEQVRRTIALIVDDLGLSFHSIYFVRRALKKFVDEQMQPGDLVAIIRTGGGIGALQQFTADKRQLYSAIDHLKWFAGGRSGVTPVASLEDNAIETDEAQAADEDLNQFRADTFAVGTLGAVRAVIDGLHELPGRKSILLISDGFRIYSRDDPTRNYRALEALQRLIDQAGRSAVVIYTMSATGLQTLGLTAADDTGGRSPEQITQQLASRRSVAFDSQEGLDYLAKETGGVAIRNANDLGGGIRRVMDDQKGYYLIGYRPDDSTFDAKTGRRKFHKLTGKVIRAGKYNFRMRNGFYGISDDEIKSAANTPQHQIVQALISPFGSAGVHVHLTSLFANDAKVGSLLRSLLYINGSDLTFTEATDGWLNAEFDVVALTFGDNGALIGTPASVTYKLRVRGTVYQRVLHDGLVYSLTVPVKKPGAYQLRAAVRDHGSERVGSASQFVEVPDITRNRLLLSSVVISGTDAGGQNKPAVPARASVENQPPDSQSGDREETQDPASSAAVRQFHRGQLLKYGLVIYNAHLDKGNSEPQLQLQVRVFRDGKPIFIGKEQSFKLNGPSDLKRLGAAGGVQLGKEMVPGEYVFQVIVKDLLADEKHRLATQWMDFEIVK